VTERDPGLRANNDPLLARLQGAFGTTDGWVAVPVEDDHQLAALAAVVGAGLSRDSATAREALARWTAHHTRAEVTGALAAQGIAAVPVLSPGEVMAKEQVAGRAVYTVVPHPLAGPIPYAQLPLHFIDAEAHPDSHAPFFGADNRNVLSERLGLSEGKIGGLYAAGLLADAPILDLPAASPAPLPTPEARSRE
jgi:crotonobetainyl-CoA:carnitine CoA-transferase CaiB-like acyl-CoA transferase